MSDNTLLNAGTGGDTVRALDRTADAGGAAGPKTQVVQVDQGGPGVNAESLVSTNNPLQVMEYNSFDLHAMMRLILVEARITNHLLQVGLNVKDELENLRADPFYTQDVTIL